MRFDVLECWRIAEVERMLLHHLEIDDMLHGEKR
jgi:hypothetical protein